jgi:hypothetical protein
VDPCAAVEVTHEQFNEYIRGDLLVVASANAQCKGVIAKRELRSIHMQGGFLNVRKHIMEGAGISPRCHAGTGRDGTTIDKGFWK